MKTITFGLDDSVVALLNHAGISFSIESVRLDEIDLKSNFYQTRLDVAQVHKDAVDEYAESMISGAIFPPIVLVQTPGKKKKEINCGRHRALAAEKTGADVLVGVIVTKCFSEDDVEKLRVVSARDNNSNGMRTSRSELLVIAAQSAIRDGGNPFNLPGRNVVEAVAERYGITRIDHLRNHIKAELFRNRCAAMKLRAPEQAQVCELGWKWVNDPQFEDMARAICNVAEKRGVAQALKESGSKSAKDAINHLGDALKGYGSKSGKAPRVFDTMARIRTECEQLNKILLQAASDPLVQSRESIEIKEIINRLVVTADQVQSIIGRKVGA